MPREVVAELPLTVAHAKWVRFQLRRFAQVPTTRAAWQGLRDEFVSVFPDQRPRPTVKQYKKTALNIDSQRQGDAMGVLMERFDGEKSQVVLKELFAIKTEIHERHDQIRNAMYASSEGDEDEEEEEEEEGEEEDTASAAAAATGREQRQQQRMDVLSSRLTSVESLLSTKEQELQQWKTKYRAAQAAAEGFKARALQTEAILQRAGRQLKEKDAALEAAQKEVRQLKAAAAAAAKAAAPAPPQQPAASEAMPPPPAASVVAAAPTQQPGGGPTFVINLHLGDIMRAAGA